MHTALPHRGRELGAGAQGDDCRRTDGGRQGARSLWHILSFHAWPSRTAHGVSLLALSNPLSFHYCNGLFYLSNQVQYPRLEAEVRSDMWTLHTLASLVGALFPDWDYVWLLPEFKESIVRALLSLFCCVRGR